MTKIDALVGHTGFVGENLAQQCTFAARFNSSNINEIVGKEFGTVVCAAAPGSMVTANRDPDRDRAAIDALIGQLDQVSARRFILISSIAVLADFAAGDVEDTQAFQQELAYGRHRRALEAFCEHRFENCLVVRLPALFGPKLRKNFVFDLLNPVPTMLPEARLQTLLDTVTPELRETLVRLYAPDAATGMQKLDRPALDADPRRAELDAGVRDSGLSATQFHNPDTTYQYYDMARLAADIRTAEQAGLSHLHVAVAPLRAADIHARVLGTPMPETGAKLHHEDMRTLHGALWGRDSPYLEDADTVLNKLNTFFAAKRVVA